MVLTAGRSDLLVEGSDRLLRQTIHDALRFGASLQELRNGLAQAAGLSPPGFTILAAVEHLDRGDQGDGVGVTLLSTHLHLSGAFVTTEVNKLVAAGLVRKAQHPCDRRRILLTVTGQGRSLLDGLGALQRGINDAIFGAFSADEFRVLATAMGRLVHGSDEALALLQFHTRQGRRSA